MGRSAKRKLFSITEDDLEISWFNNVKAGGQHSNRTNNCCRIKHVESGIIATSSTHREKARNKTQAFRNLYKNPQFRLWLKKKALYIEQNIEAQVNEMMKREEDFKIEYGAKA